MFEGNLKDSIRNCDLIYSLNNFAYGYDRFGTHGYSIDLFPGYANAPTSTYFYNELTIVIWFNKFYVNSSSSFALIDFSFNNSQNIGLGIINNEIIFFAKNSTGSINELESNYKINNKEWYHIAITYSTNSKLIYLYINGVLFSSIYVDLVLGETNLNYIGKSDTLNMTGSEILIDEIKIYNRALSSNEISIDSKLIVTTTSTTSITTRATIKTDICKYFICYNGGTCYTFNNLYAYCKCTNDYYGSYCLESNFF